MASFFNRVKEGIRNVTTPLDDLDRQFINSVERATSDVLISPDWALNLEIVDQINNHPKVCSEKVCRAIRRTLISQNTKVQMLTLTLLETVVKNVDSRFHEYFADSELFAEMQLMSDPQAQYRKVNAEVRDRILTLIENLAKAVTYVPFFRDAYEAMLDRGIDFPVRSPDDDLPFTVQAPVPRVTEPRPGGITAEALAGMSEEDRMAVQAILDQDRQAQVQAQEQGRGVQQPAAGHQDQGETYPPPPISYQGNAYVAVGHGYIPPSTAGYAPPGSGYAPPNPVYTSPAQSPGPTYGQHESQHQPVQPPAPADPQETKTMLEVVKNSRELLTEMLLSLPADDMDAVRAPYITELAGQVKRMKSQLETAIDSVADEVVLMSAISEHEEVQRVIQQYNDALARASPAPPPPATTEAEGVPPAVQPGHLFSGAPIYPGAQFSISDDEVDTTLQTRRGASPASPPIIPPPPLPQVSIASPVSSPQQNMISLDSPIKGAIPEASRAAVAHVGGGASAEDALVQQLDQLVVMHDDSDKDGDKH